jgi:hypothetical protein
MHIQASNDELRRALTPLECFFKTNTISSATSPYSSSNTDFNRLLTALLPLEEFLKKNNIVKSCSCKKNTTGYGSHANHTNRSFPFDYGTTQPYYSHSPFSTDVQTIYGNTSGKCSWNTTGSNSNVCFGSGKHTYSNVGSGNNSISTGYSICNIHIQRDPNCTICNRKVRN